MRSRTLYKPYKLDLMQTLLVPLLIDMLWWPKLRVLPRTPPVVDMDTAVDEVNDLEEDVGINTKLTKGWWKNTFTAQKKAIG
jgi:hypothetical protein